MLIIFFPYSLFLLYMENNNFAIISSTTFIIPQTSVMTADPYLFGNLNGLAGLKAEKKRH